WGGKGRPVALLALEHRQNLQNPQQMFQVAVPFGAQPPQGPQGPVWAHGLISLADGPVVAEGDEGWTWSPQKPGIELHGFGEAPVPASTPDERLAQMDKLVRRFEGQQLGFQQADQAPPITELRLLPRPLC